MLCPYLEEIVMRYCKAYPMKKMIPASSSQLVSPCFSNNTSCPIYKDVTHRRPAGRDFGGQADKTCTQPCSLAKESQSITDSTKDCVWVRQEMVSYRLCTRNYDCQSCQFEQMLIEQDGKYVEQPQVVEEVEKLRRLPAHQRRCKYTVTGKILLETCHMNYECWQCDKYKDIRNSIIENCLAEAKK